MKAILAFLAALLLTAPACAGPISGYPDATLPISSNPAKMIATQSGATVQVSTSSLTASVQAYGAVCDGSTDDSAAFAAAFTAVSIVTVPDLKCVATTGVVVPPNKALKGTFFNPGNPVSGGSIIQCPANISGACVTLGDGSTNAPATLSDLTVLGSGTIGASSVGVYVNAGYNVSLQNVNVRKFGYLYHWQAYPSTGAGLGGSMINTYGAQADTAYLWYDSWPELHISVARWGSNGGGDINAKAFFLISGGVASTAGGPNTLLVENGQFNQGDVAGPQYGIYFQNLGSGGLPGIGAAGFTFTDAHFENLTTALIGSDSSWNEVQELNFTASSFNNTSLPCLALDAASDLIYWKWVGNQMDCASFTMDPSGSSIPLDFDSFTANIFLGTFTATSPTAGSTLYLTGNTVIGATVFSGAYGNLSTTGDQFTGGVTWSQTGLSQILEAQYPAKAPFAGLALANIFTNNQQFGTDTSANFGTLDGAAGQFRVWQGVTAGVQRWVWGVDSTAESGTNSGSLFYVERHADNGSTLDRPINIPRTTGIVEFIDGVKLTGGVYSSGASAGVNCTGSPTSSFVSVGGIVTHC